MSCDYLDGVLYNIPINRISPNPKNPRKTFDQEELEKLAQSIREVGILQPLVLVPEEDGEHLRLVAGERRWRAAQLAGVGSVPALIRRLTPAQEAEIMLIENLQRRDLDPIEEAQAYQALLREHGYTQEKLAEKLGCSQSHIANRLRLLRLPDEVKENISRKILSAGHAHALLKFEKAPAFMKKAAEYLAEEQVPVAKAQEAIAEIVSREGKPLFENWESKPEFNLKECETCDFRVMGERYGELKPYCIKPSCWEKKQQEVRQAREQALADRVQKLAKKGQGVVELDKFQYNQYEEFRDYKTNGMDLSECEKCEHKKIAKRSYSDELVEVCFKPSCFKAKQAAVTREKNKEARERFKAELEQIKQLVAMRIRDFVFIPDRDLLIYLAGMILGNLDPAYDRKITLFRYLKDKFGWEQDLFKGSTWGLVGKEFWDTFRQLLETLSDEQLLELIFEWPAVARGLDGATGWILQQNQGVDVQQNKRSA